MVSQLRPEIPIEKSIYSIEAFNTDRFRPERDNPYLRRRAACRKAHRLVVQAVWSTLGCLISNTVTGMRLEMAGPGQTAISHLAIS